MTPDQAPDASRVPSDEDYLRRALDNVEVRLVDVIQDKGRARRELALADDPEELAELFTLPWLRVECAAGRPDPVEGPCRAQWLIGRGPDGSPGIVELPRPWLPDPPLPPAWMCPNRGCNVVDAHGVVGGLPPVPGSSDVATRALASFLSAPARGRPRDPSHLREIIEAVGEWRRGHPGRRVRAVDIAAKLRRGESTLRAQVRADGYIWGDVINWSPDRLTALLDERERPETATEPLGNRSETAPL